MEIVDPFETRAEVTAPVEIVDPFASIVDPFDEPEEAPVRSTKGKNTVSNSLQDIARFFTPMATSGLNAIGSGIGVGLAGGDITDAAVEGAQSDKFLGANLNMETTAGKWVEDKLSTAMEAIREFGGEQAPKLLSTEGGRTALKANPFTAPMALIYESLDDDNKVKVEGLLSAAGAAGPEMLALLVGGSKAAKVLEKKETPDIGLTDEQLLADLVDETVPTEQISKPQIGGLMEETLNPNEAALLQQRAPDWTTEGKSKISSEVLKDNLIEFEKIDPATLKSQTDDLFPAQMEETPFKSFASPRQGSDFIDTIITDTTTPKGEPGQFDLPGINQPLGGTGRKGFGQGGAIDFFTMKPLQDEGTRTNASGESTASMEAISRLTQQNQAGIRLFELDPERGDITPLNTADRVDKRPAQGKAIVQQDAEGNITVVDNNSRFGNVPLANRSKSMLAKEPLGQTGFGKGQKGAVGFKPEPKPQTLAERAKSVDKDTWVQEFQQKFPDKAQFAEQAYERVKPPELKAKPPTENQLAKAVDKGLGIVSTRIKNISPVILHRSREFERNLLGNTHKKLDAGNDFLVELNALPKQVRDVVDSAILNNDAARLNQIFDKLGGNLKSNWSKVRSSLDEVGKELVETGRLEGLRKDYFPRVVKDVDGLLNALGTEQKTELQKRLLKADSPLDETNIINSYLRGRGATQYKPGFSKERKLDEVPKELEQFYANPTEAFHTYMRNAVQDVETAKFFGKNAIKDPDTGKLDIDKSVGNVVKKELESGKIDYKQALELEDILKSRFGPGNQSSNALLQDIKNITNAGLLGNFISAATQLADPAISIYLNGLRPALTALAIELTPGAKANLNMKDFGLLDHISEEFVSQRKSAKFLNNVFKASLFSSVDQLGKNVVLNSTLNKAKAQVTTPQGLKEFTKKWQPLFVDEFPQLVSDLQSGKITEPVKAMVFSRLSDVQPISKIELPQKYLDMPNGRVIYMLKSFMLKQLDLMRNDAYNEIRKGSREGIIKGISNLAKYATVLGIANSTTDYVKDWLMGKEVDPELSDVPLNVLKTFGFSEYVLNNLAQGKVWETVGGMAAPPFKIFDEVLKDSIAQIKYSTSDDLFPKEPKWKSVTNIPLIGKLYYNWFMGGAEEANEKKQKKDTQRAREELGL